MTPKQIKITLLVIAIVVTVMEIIKIATVTQVKEASSGTRIFSIED